MLKNDAAAVQLHFLSGNVQLANSSLPQQQQPDQRTPVLRISQRMRLEKSQLEGVDRRIQVHYFIQCVYTYSVIGLMAYEVRPMIHQYYGEEWSLKLYSGSGDNREYLRQSRVWRVCMHNDHVIKTRRKWIFLNRNTA